MFVTLMDASPWRQASLPESKLILFTKFLSKDDSPLTQEYIGSFWVIFGGQRIYSQIRIRVSEYLNHTYVLPPFEHVWNDDILWKIDSAIEHDERTYFGVQLFRPLAVLRDCNKMKNYVYSQKYRAQAVVICDSINYQPLLAFSASKRPSIDANIGNIRYIAKWTQENTRTVYVTCKATRLWQQPRRKKKKQNVTRLETLRPLN